MLSISVVLFVIVVVALWVVISNTSEATSDTNAELRRFEYINGSLKGCVDACAVITLEEDTGRCEVAIDHIKASGLDSVEMFVVKRSPKGGIYGCFESHQLLAADALKKGYSSFMFFEDDARLGAPIPPTLATEIKEELNSSTPTIVYLGYLSSRPFLKDIKDIPGRKHLFMSSEPTLTHAVAMNKAAMRMVVGLKNNGTKHYDAALRDLDVRHLVVYPIIFHQCDCGTTITQANAVVQKTLGFPLTMRVLSHTSRFPLIMWSLGLSILLFVSACVVLIFGALKK